MLKIIYCFIPLIFLFLCAFLAPFLAPYDILTSHLNHLHQAPSFTYILGTDFLGRDLFSRLLFALRNSLIIGIFSSLFSVFFALFYLWLARCFFYMFWMRILEFFLALPALLLMMFFQSFLGANLFLMIFLIALVHWCFIARIVESELKRLENLDFYKANIVLGKTQFKAFFKDLLPALKTLIFILFVFNIVHAIATEATLSFFGLGLGFEFPTLGTLLSESSKAVFIGAWWMILFPLATLLLLFLPLLWLGNFLQKIWGVRS
ncbi:ABC transporter permease [Campylobacter hepaticus]|uniref:ABC transporter permease n=1 Tax=Campylobacter hepaticus TaxID=1813019 RepID=UPI0029BC4503|nr:ABC transporter permease [Campylobacter hepaticus]MDX2331440.1 ABC transporter permease [Campylobacter hepaticus]MDX2371989.1 ABC transporter permease [Campylobacter hepaticus]MDX2397276.1 ABC transporter permease [Campylobacter hepaticus]MDX5509212.1 ABC transporter permease [Campylobacter hepaticus]